MATRQFSGEFDLGDASRADISEISFPSHVSGLESFSDFDKTFPAFCDEKPPDHNTGPGDTASTFDNESLKLSLPRSTGTTSPTSPQLDADEISDSLFDLNTPNTQREQMVYNFLSQDRNPKPLFVDDQKPVPNKIQNAEADVQFDIMRAQIMKHKTENRKDSGTEFGQRSWNEENVAGGSGFDVDIEINQRPCLDGSSSDSDDGATLNFARSRIGTIHQQHLAAALEDRDQDNGSEILEERQLAEGDDVFPRDVPGDGGGGGDGSSGHSDSDVDGDGGVAIRVRSQRTQRSRMRATAAIQPIRQQNEELPERERPVGDSVPPFNQQVRNQIQNGLLDATEDSQFVSTPRSDAPTNQDADLSQESRLSARFFAAASTPGGLTRQNSPHHNLWMEDNNSFRFSDSAPVSPSTGNESQDTLNSAADNSPFHSFGTRDVVGDDSEAEKTITGIKSSLPLEPEETHKSDESEATVNDDSIFGQAIPGSRTSTDNLSPISTNPFHQTSDYSTNPFSSFAYNKNPFDPLEQSEMQNAFSFSGFGEQNSLEMGTSSFKLNSQEAEALFEEDEKSFQHSNTISKLANISSESAWNLEDADSKGEVRLSKYFNAMSEELGTMSSDRPDRPRPVFDDYKVVKTPPALRPIVLHAGGPDESAVNKVSSFSFDGPEHSNSATTAAEKTEQSIPIPKFSSTFTISKPVVSHESANVPSIPQAKGAVTVKDTIQASNGAIKMPKTNDEAEGLLHDIGVGRVSLRGISGVNISNLAAKIAVATNSDPKFILKLLISLIEGEKSGVKEAPVSPPDVLRRQQPLTAIERPNAQATNTSMAPAQHSSAQGSSRPRKEEKLLDSKTEDTANARFAAHDTLHSKSAMGRSGKQDQSTLVLSDLDRTLTPLKSSASSVKSQDPFSAKTVSSSRSAKSEQNTMQEHNNSVTTSSGRVMSQAQYSYPDSGARSIQKFTGSEDQNQRKTPAIPVNTVSHSARPVSSVIPLVALPERRPLYRDSGVQCLARFEKAQQPVERGASFERLSSKVNRTNVTTADAAIQCDVTEHGSDVFSDSGLNSISHQSLKKMSNGISNSSIKTLPGRHLSSTAIFADESYEQPTKGLTLSPVMPEVDTTSLIEQDESNWKPLTITNQNRQFAQIASHGTDTLPEKPQKGRLPDPNLKLTGEEIHDILPRISDIKVRESNAIFYPLMATNQTIMGRPSVAHSTQVQSPYHPAGKQQTGTLKTCSSDESNANTVGSVSYKIASMPAIQIIVPNEVCFSDIQCIGVSVNECLPIHNPSSRWIQCMLEVVFYSVNGVQAEINNSCAFGMQPKVFIAPHTTEDVKVTFHAELAGMYMAKVNILASPVVTDESSLTGNEIYPNVVHIEGVAELPDIEILHEQSNEIDFGEMPGGIVRARSLKLINRGRADVPLKLVLSGNATMWRHFAFVDADMAPIGSTVSDGHSEKDETRLPLLNIILPGCHHKGERMTDPEVIWIQFKAPQFTDRGLQVKIGPPNEYAARVDIEIDTSKNGIIVGSILLKAVVGIARLHAPRSLQAISLSTTEGQRVSRGIPFRNAGNISLNIQLQVSTLTDLFSVVPDHVTLSPGQSSEVFVHFLSMTSVTVESFLLVSIHPDGPQYEVVLRGTSTALKPVKEKDEKPVLLCNKPVLCWAGIPIGRSRQQRAYLRNNSMTRDLQITLAVEGNHSDFQIQNTFDFKERSKNAHEVTLKPQNEVPIHVLFVPSTFGMISSALVIRPVGDGPKFKIPLHGYGGCSLLQLTDAQKVGDNYWIDAGEVSPGKQNIVKLSLQNVGNRAAFVKILCYTDVSKREIYPSSHISIAPNDFVLLEKCTKQLVVVLQPTESVLCDAKDKPCAAASLAIFSGDECMRQLYRKNRPKSNQQAISKEGPMHNIVFDAPFMDEDKVKYDIHYPDISNWESFLVSSTSRIVVSLVAKPSAKESRAQSPSEKPLKFDPKEFIIDQTPARALPAESTANRDAGRNDPKSAYSDQQNKETWAVLPEHVVLTAPNNDKSTARLQMINYSDRPLGFEFSWPAQSLIITPSKDSVPPRSQLIVFVSTKPSFLSTGGELPWRGNIYVQCEGVQKCVRVQIREDLALDSSPLSGVSQRLAPLHPSTTPFRFKQPSKGKSLICVEPTSVVFNPTIVNKFQDSVIKIESASSTTLKWVLSSIAPPYFKEMSERGDIFRTTYTAFRFTRHSGQLQPNEATTVQVVFQPRDCGEYSQFWDLQVAVESTGETGKSRIELKGKGITSESMLKYDDGKVVGRARPILKPPPDHSTLEQAVSEPSTLSRITEKNREVATINSKTYEKKARGIFVKDDVLAFDSTNKGETRELQFRLCNDTKELQKVRFSGLKPPFSMKLNKLAIRSKSFIRVPVYFTPTEADTKSEGLLEVNALTGSSRTSYVKLTGICHA